MVVGAGGRGASGGALVGCETTGEFLAGGVGRGDISCSDAGSCDSARVLNVVILVLVVEGKELAHVRPETVLESDWCVRADLDLLSNVKSSITNPLVISSSNRSSSSDELPSSYPPMRSVPVDDG
jgi:hypothetical protein